jgi:hypothetical protein
MSSRGSLILIGLFFVTLQALVLPPDGFVTGDQGSKFLQARAFADQGPLNPAIDVQSRDIDPEYRHQEAKLKNRRGRLVSEFLWLLPLMTAPFLRVLGMHGLYVVPAVSVVVIFLAAAALGRRLGDDRGLWTAWVVLLVTPVVLYGLELWEHAPAAACVIVAALLLAPHQQRKAESCKLQAESCKLKAESWTLRAESWKLFAGAAIAAGALFREEVVVALPALLIARAISVERDRLKDLIPTAMWTALGAGLVLAASVPVNLMIYGAPLPMHMTQDAWEVAKSTPYLQVRRDVLVDLLLPASHAGVFVAAMAAAFVAAIAEGRRRQAGLEAGDSVSRALALVVHVSVAIVLVITVALPLGRLVQGVRPHDAYRVTSAAHTWPFVLAILYWPWVATESQRPMARYLILSAVLLFAGTAVLVPTSGGAQWSPRFLLAVAPLLAVVAAAAARPVAARAGPLAGGLHGVSGIAWMARAILIGSLVMQISGVFWLQRAKARNARLTHWVASRTAPGDVLITDLYWFPEVTATLAPSRRMLFSWSSADIPAMAGMAVQHGFRRFGVVTSTPLTGYEAPPALDVPGAPCRFTLGQRIGFGEMGLVLNRYGCEEP